jgi:hypothetical protein
MTTRRTDRWYVLCFAIVLSAIVLPTPVRAQHSPLINVVVVQVHYDMIAEFEALEKEANAAFKKAGMPSRQIWQVARGPANEYHIVTPAQKYAEFDGEAIGARAMGEAGWARWVATITKCVQSRSVHTLRSMPKLTIPPKEGQEPSLLVLTTRIHASGMGGKYGEWLEKELVPAKKKAGIRGSDVYRSVFGGNARAWIFAERVDKWADFDTPFPLRKSMGDEAYLAMMEKNRGMTASVERLVLRYRPELSF